MTTKTENQESIDWNVDTITEQIWIDLNGAFTRSAIQETLRVVIPRYEKARIHSFVPIFIRRDAIIRLREATAPFDSKEMGMNEAGAGVEVPNLGVNTPRVC